MSTFTSVVDLGNLRGRGARLAKIAAGQYHLGLACARNASAAS